ncbi:MAG: DUF1059 domain-containing protein [Nitrospirota bacterium]
MEKVLRCKDVGVDCDFVARGKTEEEVLKQAKEHARKHHNVKRVTKEYVKSWQRHIKTQ